MNGNLTSDGTRSFEWDAENRLVAVVKGTHRSEFGYDGFGHRVEIRELDADASGHWVSSTDTKYVWEGAEILESRTADGSSSLQRYYAQGFMDSDGTALYYTMDHLGSIRELVDASGAIRARYDYDPFGRTTKLQGDKDSPFQYAGYFWHAYSGLYFAVNREYDPNLGRWISEDPISESGGLNLYVYVGNNPINFIDPLGLCKKGFWTRNRILIAVGIAALVIFAPELVIPLLIDAAADLLALEPLEAAFYTAVLTEIAIGDAPELASEIASEAGSGTAPDAAANAAATAEGTGGADASASAAGDASANSAGSSASSNGAGDTGSKDPSTPIGRRGNPMDVARGTNSPSTINGVDYSGHALDQMQGRGVMPSVVEDTINYGEASPGNTPGTTVYTSSVNRVSVVVNSSGRVITVITK